MACIASTARLIGSPAALLDLYRAHRRRPRAFWPDGRSRRAQAALAAAFAQASVGARTRSSTLFGAAARERRSLTVDSGAHRILFSQSLAGAAAPGGAAVRRLLHHGPRPCRSPSAPPSRGPGARSSPCIGDGGLEMVSGRARHAARRRLRVSWSCFRMPSLALIEMKQRQARPAAAGRRLGRTDLAALAPAFGGVGYEVASAEELRPPRCRGRSPTQSIHRDRLPHRRGQLPGRVLARLSR